MYDIILKKRERQELSREEIKYFIDGYTRGSIPDYQASALLMAMFINGLSERETVDLTMAMANSGDTLDLSSIPGIKVDKHSTGGVGDKTTLVLAPLVASAGVPVAKMSGRGLGHTGGTIDKLESIPGLRVSMQQEEFLSQVRDIGLAVAAQTGDFAPADKKLYALRDVTATVDSIPLIVSSIMSKKIAAGAGVIVLDVKCGSGAFIRDKDEARVLAQELVKMGENAGKKVAALLTDMEQPLGYTIGNALEVKEAVEELSGGGSGDLIDLCMALGSKMLVLAGIAGDEKEARRLLNEKMESGKALEKFKEMVQRQGGDAGFLDNPSTLLTASNAEEVKAPAGGYVTTINARLLGEAAMLLGAGRQAKEDRVDPGAGIVLHRKAGDRVSTGEKVASMHYNDGNVRKARELVSRAYAYSDNPPKLSPLVLGEV